MDQKHLIFLNKAHNLAKKKFGSTFPNPVVGCLIVKNNKIVSTGVTASEGRPHAEEIALRKAGDKAKGSIMYVTLEPCFHKSRNGSCTEQIIRSGIISIYIANHDPDIRTNKKSINKLRRNDIKVIIGLTSKKTIELNNFFFHSLKKQRPFIKVKMAISQDEKIAWSNYKSKWISNSQSRNYAHNLRLRSQAIMTTYKTIIKDNPRFTVRKKGKILKYLPTIIIDNYLKTPLNCKLLKDISKKRIIIFTSTQNKKSDYLKKIGCEIFLIKKQKNDQLSLNKILKTIFKMKINDILVEAGGIFFTRLLDKKLVDEIHLFKAPFNIGKNGKPVIIGKNIKDLKYKEVFKKKIENDVYHHLKF